VRLDQLGYAVASLLGLLHDSILSRPRPSEDGTAPVRAAAPGVLFGVGTTATTTLAEASQSERQAEGKLAHAAAVASVLLSVIANVQVLLELLALRTGGRRAREVTAPMPLDLCACALYI
jgi:hypothetical protein